MTPDPSPPPADYWRQKISAYLHDSPDKALDILGHQNRAESLANVFSFEKNAEFRKDADFAAADRLPWPEYKKPKNLSARHAPRLLSPPPLVSLFFQEGRKLKNPPFQPTDVPGHPETLSFAMTCFTAGVFSLSRIL